MTKTSELAGYYRLEIPERRAKAAEAAGLEEGALDLVSAGLNLSDDQADHMVENAIGVMGLPLGIVVNMRLDGRDHLVPMAVEEPSVIAGCSYASKLLRAGGGVTSTTSAPHMIGQIQVLDVPHPHAAEQAIAAAKGELLARANASNPALVKAGGGAIDIEVRHLAPMDASDPCGPMVVLHLVVDVRDAMGANAINTMCEELAPRIAELTGGRVGLRILSNLADRRTVSVEGRIPVSALEGKGLDSGLALAKAIEEASVFAERDPYRAATHNKGIMNGIDAALIALGQDWRAVEAGAHAYAARSGRYTALAQWRVEQVDGLGLALVGRMTLPMAVGTIGGVVNVHPGVKVLRRVADIGSTSELCGLLAATGLAQNVSALRALAAEGIQSGHMRLHARNIAIQAGATGEEIQLVADRIADQKRVTVEAAIAALELVRGGAAPAATETIAPPAATTEPPMSGERASQDATPAIEVSFDARADRTFCDELLPGVSRTFALSIQALPDSLQAAICVSYLLCRVVDTVEDDRSKKPSERAQLFDAFDRALETSSRGDVTAGATFEALAIGAKLGQSVAEQRLCGGAGAVFRTFARLPAEQRTAILPSVAEMSRGMRAYSERADAQNGLRLKDVEDLEKYCYYVAGTVGELLTALFGLTYPIDETQRKELEARSIPFGLGLQLVNILKDVAEDAVRGDCFLPVKQAAQHGIDLDQILMPTERAKGIALLRMLSARARVHLDKAEEYTLLWPAEHAGQVRLFCSVPLALALATLREIELGDDALLPDRAPTVTRALVMRVFEDAVSACSIHEPQASNAALTALFGRARAGVVGRPARPSTTLTRPPTVPPPSSTTAPAESSREPQQAAPTSHRIEAMSDSPNPESSSANNGPRPRSHGLQPRRELGQRILVTGASGHVGANLVHRLLRDGRDVRVFIQHNDPAPAIDAIEAALGKRVERVNGDLRFFNEVAPATRGIDHVFHVAARVSTLNGSDADLKDIYDSNVIGTANVLRAAGDSGVKRTVVTGSLSAVGYDLDDPSKPSDESMPFYPFTEHLPYGRTKSLVEHETLKAVVEGIDAVIATSCAVLGPWDYVPSRMGRTLLDFANGKLNAYLPGGFDFVASHDLIDGHILAAERGRSGQRYILSTEFATVDQLMDLFEEVTGRRRPRLRLPPTVMAGVARVNSLVMSTFFPDVPQRFTPHAVRLLGMQRKADTTKAQTELGYKPTTIRTAIHEAYAQFAERGLVPNFAGRTTSGPASERPQAEGAGPESKTAGKKEGAAA
ncbi:MAG: hydroxymethylglutaryl-CoA reductase, degradative [Polyangiaceae bacterium]